MHWHKPLIWFLFGLCGFVAHAQQHQWAKSIRCSPYTGSNSVTPTALATDAQGNVYIGGNFRDTLYIENDTHYFAPTGSSRAIFLAKFNNDGKLIWSKSITSALNAQLKDIVINSRGKMILFGNYITSSVNPSISFDRYSLNLQRGIFLAFADSAGNFTAARNLASASTYNEGYQIALGPKDEIYTYIYLNGFSSGGWRIISSNGNATGSGFKYIYCKHDSTGQQLIWAKDYDYTEHIEIGSMAVEPNGNLIYSFRAASGKTIHGLSTGSQPTLVFIRAASINGNPLKITKSNNHGRGVTLNIVCPKPNKIYLQGYVQGDSIEIAGRKVYSGNRLGRIRPFYFQGLFHDLDSAIWLQSSTSSPQLIVGTSEMVYTRDALYTSFDVEADSFVIGGLRLNKQGSVKIQSIIAKFDTLGNALWMLPTPSSNPPMLEPLNNGDVVYYGQFRDSVRLPPFLLAKTNPSFWGFLAKTYDFSIERGPVFKGPYCAGDSILVPYTKSGVFDTSNYFVAEISNPEGNFDGTERELGRIKSTTDSAIIGKLPLLKVPSSNKYRIRIKSTSPAVQSFYQEDTLNLLIYSTDKADPGPDTAICIGDTLQLTTYGGTTWSWTPAINMNDSSLRAPSVWPDSATTYQIIIGDSSGCGAPDTAKIKIGLLPAPEIRNAAQSDTAACLGHSIFLTAEFEGGTGDYTAIWQDSSGNALRMVKSTTSDTFEFAFNGDSTIYLILTDSCSSVIDTFRYEIQLVRDKLSLPKLKDSLLCHGNLLDIQTPLNYIHKDSLSIAWYVDDSLYSTEFNCNLQVFKNFELRYVLKNKCTQLQYLDTAHISVLDSLGIELQPMNAKLKYCIGETAAFHSKPQGGNGNHHFQWLLDNVLISTDSLVNLDISQIGSIDQNTADSFWLKLRFTDSCSSKWAEDSLMVRTFPRLQITSWNVNDSIFCMGDTLFFAGLAAGGTQHYFYNWQMDGRFSTSDSIFQFVPSEFNSGRHELQLTVNDQCSDPDTLKTEFIIPDSLQSTIFNATDSALLCMNEIRTFKAAAQGGRSSSYIYHWEINGSSSSNGNSLLFQAQKSAPFIDREELIVLKTDDQCSRYSAKDSIRIFIGNRMVLSLSADSSSLGQQYDTSLCYGQSLLLKPKFYNTTDLRQSIEWHFDQKLRSNASEYLFEPALYENGRSNYELKAIGFDSCSGLYDTLSIQIYVFDSLKLAPIGDTLICFGGALQKNAQGSGGKPLEYQWQWTSSNLNTNVSNNVQLSMLKVEESQRITLNLSDGCSANSPTIDFNVAVISPLIIKQPNNRYCFDDSIEIMINASGGLPSDYLFNWWINDRRSSVKDSIITIRGDSIYNYQLVLTDGCSTPSDTLFGMAASNPQLVWNEPIDTSCEPYVHALKPADKGKTNSRFEVYLNNQLQSNGADLNLSAGTYQLNVIAINDQQCADSLNVDLWVKPTPNASFIFSPEEPNENDPLVTFEARSKTFDSLFWSINGSIFGFTDGATYLFRDSGSYTIQLTVFLNECANNSIERIRFIRNFEFLGNNAFSPNRDGINDTYTPIITGAKAFSFQIYNSWGQLIFKGDNKQSKWDGRYSGRDTPAGQYLVIIQAQDYKGRYFYRREMVQLLR